MVQLVCPPVSGPGLCDWAASVDIEAILDHAVSDTTLRAPTRCVDRSGVFDALRDEALSAFDRIVGLDLDDVALDGSLHRPPTEVKEPARTPTDRAKSGWEWSVASERHGVPIGWASHGANRHDVRMLEPTLTRFASGLLTDIGTLHLDRGYDSGAVRDRSPPFGDQRVRHPATGHEGSRRHETTDPARVAPSGFFRWRNRSHHHRERSAAWSSCMERDRGDPRTVASHLWVASCPRGTRGWLRAACEQEARAVDHARTRHQRCAETPAGQTEPTASRVRCS